MLNFWKYISFFVFFFVLTFSARNLFAQDQNLKPEFEGIEQLVLIVNAPDEVSWETREAFNCHGKELKCAEDYINRTQSPFIIDRMSKEKYIKKIKDIYSSYPKSLTTDYLYKDLSVTLRSLLPNVKKTILLDDKKEVLNYLKDRGNLIVYFKVNFQRENGLELAILSSSFFRYSNDIYESFKFQTYRNVKAIPLQLSSKEMQGEIKNLRLSLLNAFYQPKGLPEKF